MSPPLKILFVSAIVFQAMGALIESFAALVGLPAVPVSHWRKAFDAAIEGALIWYVMVTLR
jgi:hypothetical protein